MKKYFIETWGCQMNVHDSEKMAGVLGAKGYTRANTAGEADLIVFNTCSIRQKAEQKFLSRLGRVKNLKSRTPGLKIAVAGCIAQQMGEELFKRAPHVDYLVGPQNIRLVGDIATGEANSVSLEENPSLSDEELPAIRQEEGRAWVSIMYGCDNFCTYCVVPYTRGRPTSRPSASILREIEQLSDDGVKEVTLLGQNVNSYSSDTDFPGLLRKIDVIDCIERVRFVTSHPRDFSDEVIGCMAELKSVCEHIHLPLQSGSDRILELMNRGYTYDSYARKIETLRREVPGVSITTDIISGFPTETGEDHEATLNALGEVEYDGIFAFKFSPRPGTGASGMDGQLDEELKTSRLQEILALQDEITLKKNRALEGQEVEVLVEGPSESNPNKLSGRTRSNKIVNFTGEAISGEMVAVSVTRAGKHSLLGEVAGRG